MQAIVISRLEGLKSLESNKLRILSVVPGLELVKVEAARN